MIKRRCSLRVVAQRFFAPAIQTLFYEKLQITAFVSVKMGFAHISLISSVVFCLLVLQQTSSALKCWHNSNADATAEWSIVKCNETNHEYACLAQYRSFNGNRVPSYFGCHTPNTTCESSCSATEGQNNDFSCCCSGDLCNNILPTIPSPVPTDPCKAKGCSHKCIEHKGVAECYCNPGYTLDADGVTCSDLNECTHNNGACEVNCHNEVGTGHHCSCGPSQIPSGKYHCDDFDGLVCWRQNCNAHGCSNKTKQYCEGSNPICQATYVHDPVNGLQPRLLSCFSIGSASETERCSLRSISTGYYMCHCGGNLCNGNIVLPSSTT